jgi:hypothetical protein
VFHELKDLARSVGVATARLDRDVIVQRGKEKGLNVIKLEAAITILILGQHLIETEGMLRLAPGFEQHPGFSNQHQRALGNGGTTQSTVRASTYPIVKDIIERHSDGRPSHAQAFDAFGASLDRLNFGGFRIWWSQLVAELRKADSNSSPVSVCVLSATLVEGALTFVVRHAREQALGVFKSTTFDGPPNTWKIDDLVKSAASGSDSAILDNPTRIRAEQLIKTRQRIHAGRLLVDSP